MDVEMASWKSTGTYVDEVPPHGVNIVDGMWIFRVKRPPGSPPAFKARYVARGFSQRQGVDYFQTFSPTPKMTTLWVLLHVAAQRDYELHSLNFSTAFLQGSLHEEIWLRRPPGFTGSFPTDPSLFLRTDTSLPRFYVLVYVDDLVFATADTEAPTLVKSELQKRHTCTDLGELCSYLGLQITRDRARRTITLTQSHMVHHVLQRFGFQYSSPQLTPLSTSHSLSAPPSDEFVEPSGPYPELVGCLMYLMTCTRPDLAYPLSLLARYVAPGRHRKVHRDAAKRVLRYLCSTSGMGLVLGGRGPVVLTGHADASWVDDSATQRSLQGYTFSLGSGLVSWRSTRSSSVLSSHCEAEIYARAMAAQELRWLNYLLTNLGEQPRSPPVLYVNNKAMIALCQEHRLEHRTKHIAMRYFLARELQQRGQLRLAYVATRANTADVFAKALPPGDHQRFVTVLGLLALLFLTGLMTIACSGYPPLRLWGLVLPRLFVLIVLPVLVLLLSQALRPSSAPLCVALPSPPMSSLPDIPNPDSNLARAATPTVTRLLATDVSDPDFESIASESVCPPSVEGEPALDSDVLEDRQFELECVAATLPRFASMLLCPEGDLNALNIPTPRNYAEAIAGEYSSQWQKAMDAKMASWKSTGTYVDEVPSPGANMVPPPGSTPAFKERYVARGFSQRQGVEFFQTFSPTPKITTLWVLLHVAAQRDYELHSLDFSTAFVQGSLHEEIWLRRPPGFTGSCPAGTKWSLRRPVYGLRQAPREWLYTLRMTLVALGFAPSTADPSLFLRTDTSWPSFYVLVYVLQRFGFQYSLPQPSPPPTGHSLSAPPSDESVEPSGPYPELVGCLMYLMTCTRPDLVYPLSLLARYMAPGRHQNVHWDAAKRL
ncbi:unnamed protein product [Closterium sp. NIES-53]